MKVLCKFCTFNYHSPTKNLECPSCGNTEERYFQFQEDDEITTDNPLIRTWVEIGRENYWIARAYDPEFDENSFYECQSVSQLIEKLEHGNWSVGSAFYYKDLAFINQVDGGDEWKVIRGDKAFESWSCGYVIRELGVNNFASTLYQMIYAEDVSNYTDVEVPETFQFEGGMYERDMR